MKTHLRSTSLRMIVAAGLVAGTLNVAAQPPPQPPAPAGLTLYNFGDPSGDETELLQAINRTRANPAAEAPRLVAAINVAFPDGDSGIDLGLLTAQFQSYPARPPLAFNAKLNAAAKAHTADMLAMGVVQHNSSDGTGFATRVISFGYAQPQAENASGMPGFPLAVAYYPPSNSGWVLEASYEIDSNVPSLGHRFNVLEPFPFSLGQVEVGISTYAFGDWNTTDFGADRTPPLLTGAVYVDQAGTGFYKGGEGVSSVVVTAPGASTFYAVTSKGGAYTLPLDLVPICEGAQYVDPVTGITIIPPPSTEPPVVTVTFTDAQGGVTKQTVTLTHTVAGDGFTTYWDAQGKVRYDNVQVNRVQPATAGTTPPATPTPTPTPTPIPAKPQVTVTSAASGRGFILARTGSTDTPLLVTYKVGGTALAGRDYVPLTGTKKIKAGKDHVTIPVRVLPGGRGTLKLKVTDDAAYSAAPSGQVKIKLTEPQG